MHEKDINVIEMAVQVQHVCTGTMYTCTCTRRAYQVGVVKEAVVHFRSKALRSQHAVPQIHAARQHIITAANI